MTHITSSVDPFQDAVPAVLRHVAPPEAPWPAAVVRLEQGAALLVDADLLPGSAHGPAGEHVARPIDVYRTDGGQLALMPHVTRAVTAGMAADAGAAVTLAVSLLRGVMEAASHPDAPGRWWVAADGRPMFVPVRDAPSAAATAAELMREVGAETGLPLLAELADVLGELEPRDLAGWEDRLFGLHPAAAIGTADIMPEPSSRRTSRERGGQAATARRAERRPAAGGGLLAVVDGSLAALASDAGTAVWRALRRLRVRRRVLVVGAAAAAALVVVTVGLLWPEGSGDPVPVAVEPVATGAAVAATPTGEQPDQEDVLAVAAGLLDGLRECGDAACRAALMEDPAVALPAGTATTLGAPALTLVDDLGGLAVVRAEAPDATTRPQIVLLVQRDGKWLVRDVYDAADQR